MREAQTKRVEEASFVAIGAESSSGPFDFLKTRYREKGDTAALGAAGHFALATHQASVIAALKETLR